MRILAIETSCDETAASIIEASGTIDSPSFAVLGQMVHSQIEAHRPYGGVFPNLAKREHALNIVPVLASVFDQAKTYGNEPVQLDDQTKDAVVLLLHREEGLNETFLAFIENNPKPAIDAICVTSGPGLEPALWVGIKTAQALAVAWNIPVYPVNHMEGHVVSVLVDATKENLESIDVSNIQFPILSLLISGGHTELVSSTSFTQYEKIGQTLDDAVGEAFDKVARIIGLPYPGGPEIGKLAHQFRKESVKPSFEFPRPMLRSGDLNFSFSGLKTAVLYHAKKVTLDEHTIKEIACAFENAVADVLVQKTKTALIQTNAKTLIVAGGVAANTYIKEQLQIMLDQDFPDVALLLPRKELATDNSVMIAIAGYIEILKNPIAPQDITANGNWSLGA